MSIRKRFSPSVRVQSVPEGDSLTHQSFAQEADINHLVSKHMRGAGRFGNPIGNPNASRQPIFGDFSSIDYHTMCNQVLDVQNMFRTLPARMRSRFHNDPYQLIRFVEDPANLVEAVKLGLVVNPEVAMAVEDAVQADLVHEAEKASLQASKPVSSPPSGGLPQGDK